LSLHSSLAFCVVPNIFLNPYTATGLIYGFIQLHFSCIKHPTPLPNMALWYTQEQLCLTFIFKHTWKKFSCCLLSKRLRPHEISAPLCILICIIQLSTYSMLTCVALKNIFLSNSSRSLLPRITYLLLICAWTRLVWVQSFGIRCPAETFKFNVKTNS
jgi:hypothetical protein